MKKLFKILILSLITVVCAVGLFACGGGGNSDGKTGLLYKMYEGDDYYTVYGYVKAGEETELDIGSYNTETVTIKRIKAGAFKDNDNLKKITVPDTVEIIDGGAFENMKVLEQLDLPFIGKTAVADVYFNSTEDALRTDISVGNERNFGYIFGTTEYEGGVGCTQNYDESNTSTYYIPETLRTVYLNPAEEYGIPMYAFAGNCWISTLVLSGKVKTAGEGAFKDNAYLVSVNAENITAVYDNAFNGTKNITSLTLTALTLAGENAFAGNTALKAVYVNVNIPHDAFAGNTALTTLTVGANVTFIGARAFYNCGNISDITVEGTNSWTVNGSAAVLDKTTLAANVNFDWTR